MLTPVEILEKMDALLDRLIQTAETMQRLSKQVVSESELGPLQKAQEELVVQLTALDLAFQIAYKKAAPKKPLHSTLRATIAEKMERFQSLNRDFIANLKGEQKLIEVEAPSLKKTKNGHKKK